MPIALDTKRETRYVLRCDRESMPETQTVFILRAMKCRENAEVKDDLVVFDKTTQDVKSRGGSTELKVLRFGLIGCENFKDSTGADVKFLLSGGVVADAFIDRLAYDWRVELANAITKLSDVPEPDLGN